jgi:hypothetical protein
MTFSEDFERLFTSLKNDRANPVFDPSVGGTSVCPHEPSPHTAAIEAAQSIIFFIITTNV